MIAAEVCDLPSPLNIESVPHDAEWTTELQH
jgi:hypothetical protein